MADDCQPGFEFGGPLPEPVIERVLEPGCCPRCYCLLENHVPGFGCLTIAGWAADGGPVVCPCNEGEMLDDNKAWEMLDDGKGKRRKKTS